MRTIDVDLSALSLRGAASVRRENSYVVIQTPRSISDYLFNIRGDVIRRSCVMLPEKYRLPLRIDITAQLDFPALILLIGEGHVVFGTQGRSNRVLEDIIKPTDKPNQDNYSYDDTLPLGKTVNISVTYGLREMQILINGEERFYSQKLPYMKAKNLVGLCDGGLELGLAVPKLATLKLYPATVTELDSDAAVTRGNFVERRLRGG